jgi:hypothetical protein
MKIAITADLHGYYSVSEVAEVAVPAKQMASMRANGQNDCGRRQSLFPLAGDDGPLVFWGNGAKREASEAAAKFMAAKRAEGLQVELIELDRSVPCI